MIQSEIARLTGKLVFQVDNRPLMNFEKRLNGVISLLGRFQSLANKKVTMRVDLDSKSLRSKITQAQAMKISFKNFELNSSAINEQSKKLKDRLEKTSINLSHVKLDVAALVAQKKFLRTFLGQTQINLEAKFRPLALEKQVKDAIHGIETRNRIRLQADLNTQGLVARVRKALRHVETSIGKLRISIAAPAVKVKADEKDLRAQLKRIIEGTEYNLRIRINGGNGLPIPHGGGGSVGRAALGGGLAGGLMGFARGAIPGLGAAFAFNHMNQISQAMQGQQLALTAVTGSSEKGAEQKAWVENLANQIGLDVRSSLPSYTKMLASGTTVGMSTESVQNIFQGVSEYGRVMGLDKDSMKGSMRAIEQMMNKGQVMSEELKGQLAERMPGAISAMAEAAGFGTDPKAVAKLFDALQKGQVKSADVLEKFAKILAKRARDGGALEKAVLSTAAQQARFNNAFTKAVEVFSAAGFDRGMGSFFKTMADSLKRAKPLIEGLGFAFEVLVKPINAVINLLGYMGGEWDNWAQKLGLTTGELTLVAAGLGMLVTPFGWVAGAIAGVALALEDLVVWSKGGKSVFGDWIDETDGAGQAVDHLKASFDEVARSVEGLGKALYNILEALGLVGEKAQGINFNQTFISSLDKLANLLDSLAGGMEALTGFFSMDFDKMGKGLGQLKDGLDQYAKQQLIDMTQMMIQWSPGIRSQIEQSKQTAPVGQSSQQATTNNEINAPISLIIQVPPGSDGQALQGPAFEAKIQQIAKDALRDAFGQVRASQSEK